MPNRMTQINIRANNIELTAPIEEYIYKKAESFDKYLKEDSAARLSVEVAKTTMHHKQGDVFRTEFNLAISGAQLRAEAETGDLYAALDEAKDELLSELRNHKDKRLTLLKRGHQRIKEFLRRFK